MTAIARTLDALPPLGVGAHASPDEGCCIMEAVAWVSGAPWSDHPECASPVIRMLAAGASEGAR